MQTLAQTVIIAAFCWARIRQAALTPIDKFVDWLEGVHEREPHARGAR